MVSNVGDQWKDEFPKRWPQIAPFIYPTFPPSWPNPPQTEMDALRKEIEELKKLLKAAKRFDEATGQPHCEMDEKVALIKKIAKLVGVDLEEVFGEPSGGG